MREAKLGVRCCHGGGVVREFEAEVCRLTGARHAVAFSSCTAGLMLAPKAMNLPSGGEVIVPSFTFAATAQALAWNGLVPVFCDCLPGTCALDPEDVEQNITGKWRMTPTPSPPCAILIGIQSGPAWCRTPQPTPGRAAPPMPSGRRIY